MAFHTGYNRKMSNKSKKIVVANWKMNPENEEAAKRIFLYTKKISKKIRKTDIIVCPPFVYLPLLSSFARKVSLGAQDVFWEENGSYTGEVSARMIKGVGAKYVIIGHSERRALGDSDEIINKKIKAALNTGLSVILCVGEKERDPHGAYLEFLSNQIHLSLGKVSKKEFSSIMVAYEPIWAIGAKSYKAIDGQELHETALFIRKTLSDMYGYTEAMDTPILYGGSVNAKNANEILTEGGVQGFLVGRQSLEKELKDIIDIAESFKTI